MQPSRLNIRCPDTIVQSVKKDVLAPRHDSILWKICSFMNHDSSQKNENTIQVQYDHL